MIDWAALITIVTVITGGIVGIMTLYINSRVGELTRIVKAQTATIASLHAIILGQHDPLQAIEGALTTLKAQKHPAPFEAATPEASEERFPRVDADAYEVMKPFRQAKK